MLLYVQRGSVDIWKENVIEDLEGGNVEYISVEDFLADLKIEFEKENNKLAKVTKLKRVEQRERTIKEFIQKLKRVARESSFE